MSAATIVAILRGLLGDHKCDNSARYVCGQTLLILLNFPNHSCSFVSFHFILINLTIVIIMIILKSVPLADPPSVGTTGKSLLDLVTRSPHPHHLRGGQDLELAPFCKICNCEK